MNPHDWHRHALALIDLLYEGLQAPDSGLPRFLARYGELGGFSVTSVGFAPARALDAIPTVFCQGLDEAGITAQWAAESFSPFSGEMAALPDGRHCAPGTTIVPRAALLKTAYYHDFMRPYGMEDSLSAVDKQTDRGMLVLSGLTPIGERITDDQVALTRALAPHVCQVVELHRQLGGLRLQVAGAREALSRATFGCLFVDAGGQLVWANDLATELLAAGSGLVLRGRQLGAVTPTGQRALEAALRAALQLSAGRHARPAPIFALERGEPGPPLEVLVSPLRTRATPVLSEQRGAMVLVCDPKHVDEGFGARLQARFGLTDTEAEVAQWLLSGESPARIAEIFGRSVHTIRSHLRAIFEKTGTASQAEAVSLFQRTLARLR